MNVDASHGDIWQLRRVSIQPERFIRGDAKLVLLQPRRDVGMGSRVDVWIDTQAHRGAFCRLASDPPQGSKLTFGFDVEAKNPCLQCQGHLCFTLAHAGKYNLARIAPGRDYTRELAARNDIEAAAQASKNIEHCQIRVGLHGIADKMRQTGKGAIEVLECAFECCTR